MTDSAKTSLAWDMQNAEGVSRGNGILYRAAMVYDLSLAEDRGHAQRIAVHDLLGELSMKELRSLCLFWDATPWGLKTKRELAGVIARCWVLSVHPTFRPRSNASIVILDCPAKWCK